MTPDQQKTAPKPPALRRKESNQRKLEQGFIRKQYYLKDDEIQIIQKVKDVLQKTDSKCTYDQALAHIIRSYEASI